MKKASTKKKSLELVCLPESYIKIRARLHATLLVNIKRSLADLEALLEQVNDHWVYEDYFYRFYHQSFKVYYVQAVTVSIVNALRHISPLENKDIMDKYFLEIIKDGVGKEFTLEHNDNWTKHCRPMIEAFAHAKFFLEMAVKYGNELETAPKCLPSGWAALLYLYNIR